MIIFFQTAFPKKSLIWPDLIKQNASGALCDHRLAFGSYASFQGAELVAFLYDIGFPALLVTQYSEIDADVSIRKWRKKIPTLISREEMSAEFIKIGFEKCLSELRGTKNTERIAHRTLLRVTGREYELGEEVVDVVIPGWNPQGCEVSFIVRQILIFGIKYSSNAGYLPILTLGQSIRKIFSLKILRWHQSYKMNNIPEMYVLDVGHGNCSDP